MSTNKKDALSADLINITTNSKPTRDVNYSIDKSNSSIELEDDGYYKITIGNDIIRTKISDRFIEDIKLMGILPANATTEESTKVLEGYLIAAAKQFLQQNLNKIKQDGRGKLDVPGIDDEF